MNYNIAERTTERDFFQLAREFDLAIGAWGPLGRGLLGLAESKGKPAPDERDRLNNGSPVETIDSERKKRIADEVMAIARECERHPAQVLLNWVRQHKTKPVVIPILGARVVDQFENNLGSLEFELSPAHLERLDEVSKTDWWLGYLGHSGGFINGEFEDKIDSHRPL
jgi:aryl-alcohol dehydrogenase-like predicted oxidoreductase